jgi:autotransporter-associated beta strand protein
MRNPKVKISKAVLMTAAALITCAPIVAQAQVYATYANYQTSGGGVTATHLNNFESGWRSNFSSGYTLSTINLDDLASTVNIRNADYVKMIGSVKVNISSPYYNGSNTTWGKRASGSVAGYGLDIGTGGSNRNIWYEGQILLDFNGTRVSGLSFWNTDFYDYVADTSLNYSRLYVYGLDAGNNWIQLAEWGNGMPITYNKGDSNETSSTSWAAADSDRGFLGVAWSGAGYSKLRINVYDSGGAQLDNLNFAILDQGVLAWNAANPAALTPSGGSGVWYENGTGTANWLSSVVNGSPVLYADGKPVIFSGPTYPTGKSLVSLGSYYSVYSLTFDTANYVIGSIENQGVITVSSGQINVNQEAIIQSRLSGANLYKNGAGKLILTGDSPAFVNSITSLTVNSGILQIGLFDSTVPAATQGGISYARGLTGSLDANIALGQGTEVVFYRANNLEYSKVISMTGTAATLTKDGVGTLYLTNTSNVSTVKINASGGALSFGKGSLTGSASTSGFINQDILNNGSLWFNRTDSFTYAGVISGTGSVVKKAAGATPTGMLTLTGASTYSGGTTIEAGILRLLGDGGVTSNGKLNAAGNVIIASATAELRFDNSDDRTAVPITGIISGLGSVYKTGTGRVNLSALNNYSGLTTVANGWLVLSHGSALGAVSPVPAAGTVVNSGATLAFRNGIVTSEAISVSGFGYLGDGALRNIGATSDVNTLAGQVTLQASSSVRSALGTLEIRKMDVVGGQSLTVNGSGDTGLVWFSNSLSLGAGKLTKDGGGIARISAVAAYSGGLLIKAGQLDANSITALGQGAAVDVGEAGGSTTPVLNLGMDLVYGGTVTLHNGSITGNNQLTSTTRDFELHKGTVTAVLAGGVGIRKTTTGTVVIGSAGSFTGSVTVSAGTLKITDGGALGDLASATSVVSGATLEFGKPTIASGINVAEQVTIAGTGIGSVGAIRNSSGANTLSGQLALSADAEVQVEAGSSLAIAGVSTSSHTLTAEVLNNGASLGALSFSGPFAMAGGKIVKIGSGTLNLNAATDFDGGATDGVGLDIQLGTVKANHVAALGAGRVQVGTASVSATLDISTDVTLHSTITLNRGTISSGRIYGAHTLTADLFDLRDGTVTASLYGTTGLDKTSSGTVTLWGNNTYLGQTNVTGGLLMIGSRGLGATGAGNDTIVGYDPTLHTWGSLALRKAAQVVGEVITIAGDGHDKLGALRTQDNGGIEAVLGDIIIMDVNGGGLNRGRINNYDFDQANDGDEALNLAGIAGAGADLYFGAWKKPDESDGKIIVNGVISLGAGKIVSELKDGAGVLTLRSANSFSGGAEIRSGKLVAAHEDAMGTGAITVGTWRFLPTEEGQATVIGSRAGVFRTEALLRNLGNITLVNGTLEGLYPISSPNVELQRGLVNVSLAGSGAVRKTTGSTVGLRLANTYDGATNIDDGILEIYNSAALGSSLGATTVNGGTLRIARSRINLAGEDLFLNGQGVLSGSVPLGALYVTAGGSTLSGRVTLQSAARINSDASSFTLSGSSSIGFAAPVGSFDAGYDLYLGGRGNITLAKVLELGTGKLIKDGSGRLYINANQAVEGINLLKGSTVLSGATITTQAAGLTINNTTSLAGYGAIVGDVIVKSGTTSTITPGNAAANPAVGTWAINTGNLTFEGSARIIFNRNAIAHSLVAGFLVADITSPFYPYDWSKSGNGSAPIVVAGNVNLLSAPQAINLAFSGVRARPGVYKIMEYSGTVIGGDFSGIGPSPFRSTGIRIGVRQSASFKTDLIPHPGRSASDHGFLTLEVSKGTLHWRGDRTNEWDLSDTNWFLDSNTNPALRVNFLQEDLVVFDDSAVGPTDILVKPYASLINPVLISFENTDVSVGGKDYRLYRANDGYVSLGSLVTAKSIYMGEGLSAGVAGKLTLSTATTVIDEGVGDEGFYLCNGWVRAGHDGALGGLRVFLEGGRLSAEGSDSRTLGVSDAFYLNSDEFMFGSLSDAGSLKLVSDLVMAADLSGVITTESPLELASGVISRDINEQDFSIPSYLVKRGASKLIISGTAYGTTLFDESLLIQEGTLQLGDGGSTGWIDSSVDPIILAGAKLVFDHSGDPYTTTREFAGAITGAGSLEKLGTDRLNLTSPNSVIGGGVTVTSGNLAVNPGAGALTANVTVGANGILSGSGRIIGNVFINGGRHEPGNSPGLVTYDNLTYGAGSTIRWELNANSNSTPLSGAQYFDRIRVTQNLTFAGPTSMELSFQPTLSQVDWANEFWSTVRTWRVYEVDGALTGYPSNLGLVVQNWQDANGVFLTTRRLEAKFSLESESGTNNIILKYVPYGSRADDVDLGYVHVGDTFSYDNIKVRNTSVNSVDVVLTNPTSNVTIGSGSVNNVTDFNAPGTLTATLNSAATTTSGSKVGTVRAEFTNQPGAVADGYDLVRVTGTVIELAQPVINPLTGGVTDFGCIRISNPSKAYAGSASLSHLNQSFASQNVDVANVSDQTYGENLEMRWKSGSAINSSLSSAVTVVTVLRGTSEQTLSATLNSTTSPGVTTGSAKLLFTSVADTSVTGLSNTVLPEGNVQMSGKVYYHAYGEIVSPIDPTATIDLGKVRQNAGFSARSITIRNDVGNNPAESAFYEKLGARFSDITSGVLATGTVEHLAWNDPAVTALQVSLSSAAPGRISGTTSLVFVTEGDGTAALPSAEIGRQSFALTGEVYAPARIDVETIDLGRRHEKGTFEPVSVAIANYQDGPADYVDRLDVNVLASPTLDISGATSLTGLVAGAAADTTVKVKLKDSVAQHYNLYTETLTLTGVSRPTDGITSDFALPNKTVEVQALVYSGKSHWLGGATLGQLWTQESWNMFPTLEGVPGRDGVLSTYDEITFEGVANGFRTVTLSGYSPQLAKLNFGGNTGTTLQPDAGAERIILGLGLAEAAQVNNGAGDHHLNVAIDLHQDLLITAFGQALVFKPTGYNAITQKTQTAGKQLTLIGGGMLGFLRPIVGDDGADTWRMNVLLQGPTVMTVSQDFDKLQMEDGQILSGYYLDGDSSTRVVEARMAEKTTTGTVKLGSATQFTRSEAEYIHFRGFGDLPVKAGSLYNNANVEATITVWNGATLGGVGYSGDIRVLSGGTLAPGNSIGTITTTDLNIAQGATYHVEFNGDGADNAVVTAPGGATVKGGIKVVLYPSASLEVADKVFTIIEHTSGIHDISPDPTVDTDIVKNGVYFDAATAEAYLTLTPMIRTFADHTELYFATYRNIGEPRTISSLPNIMGRTGSMFLRAVSGDPYARLQTRGPSSAQGITQQAFLGSGNNLDEAVSGALDGSWVQGYAQAINANQGSGNWGYDYRVGGVAAGLDLIREPSWVMGVAFGLSQSDATHEYQGDKTAATAYDIALYTASRGDDATVSFTAFYSNYSATHTRLVDMGILTKPATGKPDAFRLGVRLDYDNAILRTPDSKTYLRLGLGAGLAHRDSFSENGDEAIAMNFDAVNMTYFQLDMGLGYSVDLFEDDHAWQLFGEGMFTRHVVGENPTCRARFLTPVGVSGEVAVPSPEYTFIQFQPSVGVTWSEDLNSAEFKVFAEMRAGRTATGASASYKMRF